MIWPAHRPELGRALRGRARHPKDLDPADPRTQPVYYEIVRLHCRPRGLPIGNLTSQFWSNCYLHPFDQFVTRELHCQADLRYVDDFALFGDDKRELWAWKRGIVERLARLRLTIHERAAQVLPVGCGIPWLGFVVHPTHRRVKAGKMRASTRHLGERLAAYRAGQISFAELDASVRGWVNHVRCADTWGLRRHMFARLPIASGFEAMC